MSTWFYGVLSRTDSRIVVMYVGKSLGEEIVERHIEYAKVVRQALNISGVLSTGSMDDTILNTLNDAVAGARNSLNPSLLLYALLVVYSGIRPEILSEYELEDLESKGIEVVVLGE